MEKTTSSTILRPSTSHRLAWLAEGVMGLVLAILLGSRALDTGSWQQYFLTLILLIFSINRFIHAIKGPYHDKK